MRLVHRSRRGSGQRQCFVTTGKVRIEIDSLLKKLLCKRVIDGVGLLVVPQPALVSGPGVEAFGWFAHRTMEFRIGDGRGDGDRYSFGDLVLDREDLGEIAVVALGPDVF